MTIRVTTTTHAVFIDIDRPDKRNALDLDTSRRLGCVLEETRSVGVPLVIGSTTPGLFVSGADIADLARRTRVDAIAQVNHKLFLALEEHPSPTIAVVDGPALGGGFELAIACDFRVSSTRAQWGLPEVRLGIIPSAGGLWRLPRLVGWGTAIDLILTGRRIDGTEAQRIGLTSRLCSPGDIDNAIATLLEQLSHSSSTAIDYAKQALRSPTDRSRTAEAALQALCFESSDAGERLKAFLTGRGPSTG